MFGWLLSFVWMLGAGVNIEFTVLVSAEAVFRKHAVDGAFDEKHRAAFADGFWSFYFLTTDVAGEARVDLRVFFITSQAH